ncbi:hypothetical protein HY838_02210 [Candidatus Azambacteria bacterium]|nr:hypothetical protein [Candidatus Azambacteria bacterium]
MNIEEYKKIDWNKLLRKDLGEYSLEVAKPNLDRIKSIFDEMLNYPNLDQLSNNFKNQIEFQLNSFIQFSNQIVNNFQNTNERQIWIDNIKNKEFEIYQNLSTVYRYIKDFDPSRDERLKDVIKKSEERIKKLNEDLSKTEVLLQQAQKKAVQSEVMEYGNFFGNEAFKNERTAKINRWLMFGSIILAATLSIIFLQNIRFVSSEKLTFFENILQTVNTQNILIKFILLSLGGYLIAHFSKIHSTEKNLYNFNIQRQNALNSHKQILDSVVATESENEKEIRNAILLELTRAIFANHETGYLKDSKDNPGPSNQIIEITKTLTK